MDPVRNVNVGRGYAKADRPIEGLKSAVKTNRTFLALEYLLDVVIDFDERLAALEGKKTTAAKPAAKKATATKESSNDGKE